MDNSQDSTMETDDDAALAGPSSINQQNNTIGDHVLVKFILRKTEYCYAAAVNKIRHGRSRTNSNLLKNL